MPAYLSCSFWQPVLVDSQPKSSGLVLGRRPLGTILHSSNEPGELSQWLCHDDSTINIVVVIIIITYYYYYYYLQPRNCVRNLRSSDTPLLCQPFTKTDLARRGFRYSAAAVWNSLPKTVLESPSLTVFEA